MKPSCTLVTPTYNWPQALELLLLSVLKQTQLPDEVIVANDGSGQETTNLIERFQQKFPVPLIHIRHEDHGNRKPAIMNKAVAAASGDYIIEIDGDIIMHKDFVKDHLAMSEPKTFLYGSRATIQEKQLPELFEKKQIHFNFFSKGIKKRNRTLRIPLLANQSKREPKRSSKLRGCNMSFWKSDFIAINGFNEELVGWGIDDSEMIQRMVNNGVYGKRLKHKGLAYHIYHKEQDKSHIQINQEIEEQAVLLKSTYINKGIDQYL